MTPAETLTAQVMALLRLPPAARALRCSRIASLPLLGAALLLSTPLPQPGHAQEAGYGQSIPLGSQDRQMFGNGGAGNGLGGTSSGLGITNPMDLINRIRRSTALDDATPPASAVDQALKALEEQSLTPGGASPARPASTAGMLQPAVQPLQGAPVQASPRP